MHQISTGIIICIHIYKKWVLAPRKLRHCTTKEHRKTMSVIRNLLSLINTGLLMLQTVCIYSLLFKYYLSFNI